MKQFSSFCFVRSRFVLDTSGNSIATAQVLENFFTSSFSFSFFCVCNTYYKTDAKLFACFRLCNGLNLLQCCYRRWFAHFFFFFVRWWLSIFRSSIYSIPHSFAECHDVRVHLHWHSSPFTVWIEFNALNNHFSNEHSSVFICSGNAL